MKKMMLLYEINPIEKWKWFFCYYIYKVFIYTLALALLGIYENCCVVKGIMLGYITRSGTVFAYGICEGNYLLKSCLELLSHIC